MADLMTFPMTRTVEHAHHADSSESAGGYTVATYLLYSAIGIPLTLFALVPGAFLAFVLFVPALMPLLFWALIATGSEQIARAK